MNSALFQFTDEYGGQVIVDLSFIGVIQKKSTGEIKMWFKQESTWLICPDNEYQRLVKAWSDYHDRQEEQSQPMMMMMGQPEDNSGLVDVFGGGLR